jgi:hypothetical protein
MKESSVALQDYPGNGLLKLFTEDRGLPDRA